MTTPTNPGGCRWAAHGRVAGAVLLSLGLTLGAGCAVKESAKNQSVSEAAQACSSISSMPLEKTGQLTVGTDAPAYDPWFFHNDPSNGKGFESAVTYALAEELGFSRDQVHWVTVPFNSSYAPGAKNFDFDINQISITPAREKAVTFSNSYYTVQQAVIVPNDSPYASETSLSELKDAKLGVQVGTTAYEAVKDAIGVEPVIFNDTNDAKNALENGQIDGIVVDLPTAFYLTAAVLDNAKVLGRFDFVGSGRPEEFGLLLAKDNPLVTCLNQGLEKLKSDGTLDRLQEKWLSGGDVPEMGDGS